MLKSETSFTVFDRPLGGALTYLKALVEKNPGVVEFRTGASHIFFDLVNHLPSIPNCERQKRELCHLIAELVYPLAANLSAQAVALTLTISGTSLTPPGVVKAMATYLALDANCGSVRHCFMSPEQRVPAATLTIPAGMSVLCEPLNYHYHQLKDDRELTPREATANLPVQGNRNVDPAPSVDEKPPAAEYPVPDWTSSDKPAGPKSPLKQYERYLTRTPSLDPFRDA